MSSRARAIAAPGIVLSQPTRITSASNMLARATSSIESAMTSRLTSDIRMPSVPMVMPSDTETVLNSIGVAAGSADAVLHRHREAAQVQVARTDFDPGVGDPDEGLAQVVVREPDRLEHGAGGGTMAAAEAADPYLRTGHVLYRRTCPY